MKRSDSASEGGIGPQGSGESLPRRTIIGIYGTAFFSLSMMPMASILVPLWLVALGASPLTIGIAIGARSLLPLLLSIHGGVLMDRLGPRRVTLAVAVTAALLFLAYPLMPWIAAIIVLQMIFGLAQGLCWVGAQTFYGQKMRGHAGAAGRLVLFSNGGCFVGPLALGAVLQFGGTHLGFGFLCLWGTLMVAFTLLVPPDRAGRETRPALRDLMPKPADYRSALDLCHSPVVMLVMIFTFIRIANASIQTSFYVVYLGEIHMGESLIGILLGTGSFVATITPALVQSLERRIPTLWLLVGATVATILFMAVTPLIVSFWFLFGFAAAYGAGVGLGFPTLLAMLSRAIPLTEQGKSVGLRTTVNRLASLLIPVIMGAVAEVFGIRFSFLVVAMILLAATAATVAWARRPRGLAG